jgi:hypothetical protein
MIMSSFQVTEHVIPCQHIREYPNGIKKKEGTLRLAVKQYQPLNNLEASLGSWTVLATHANGVPKVYRIDDLLVGLFANPALQECYEPLWEELLRATNVPIRAIWIADCSHQGVSGVLNEDIQGDDPSWFDHSRDLLQIVNQFRDQIQQPIMGVGHSLGGPHL